MGGTSFLRRVSLHGFRGSSSNQKLDEPKRELDDQIPDTAPITPETQTVLLLHGARQPYQLTENHPVPSFKDDREILVRTQAIGLNPMDWKAPRQGKEDMLHVIVISTDYRDLRKAAYQQYVVAPDYNTVRLPPTLSPEEGSSLGVAFVVAAISLGVCIGLDFTSVLNGPDLYTLIRQLPPDTLAQDIQKEALHSLPAHERAQPGDWLAIWGGSSTSAHLTLQLARLAGLRTIAVADKAKHGLWLSSHKTVRPDLLVDSHDPARAVAIIRANVQGTAGRTLRFAADTRGRESAGWLLEALQEENEGGKGGKGKAPAVPGSSTPPSVPVPIAASEAGDGSASASAAEQPPARLSAHLIGLTGLPKQPAPDGVVYHTVPIKLFHEVPAVGQALVEWLERLLQEGLVTPPNIIDVQLGLGSVNQGLDRMRRGEISGGKLVVRID
ncbi:hypothetical protein CHGG_02346 [Chaetomium globosum CBS 148.51]|uniref:Enoyl reductase (ER) domain-containing protein n=1 Tax=Chaetomium globosum (strain ATCC 6205 / CBS 148.51 / DSM 1962 / NBRC 6347 / NRRL 1970) TaxID=306901 RepID=Q2HBQ8_CHAGB|nr:uncharacterized protein CHGG_02346 [Chaetomium globosum CBS 148.51]EAQ90411.1 hypothetical protein CHGG_02346 [Chaetomium globosum CBS 148.51]